MGHKAWSTAVHCSGQLQLLVIWEDIGRKTGNIPGKSKMRDHVKLLSSFVLDKPLPYFPTFSSFVNFFTEQTFIFRTLDKEKRIKINLSSTIITHSESDVS